MKREPDLVEWMDRRDCDPNLLRNTYRQFTRINRLFARPGTIYQRYIQPILENNPSPVRILDIGFGAGDLPAYIARRAQMDGYDVRITAIDTDQRSVDYARGAGYPGNIEFIRRDVSEWQGESRSFDVVMSNHLLHHIAHADLAHFLESACRLSVRSVIMSDIHRSRIAHVGFRLLTRPFFRHSFVVEDGLISIRRSFKPDELRAVLPTGWEVEHLFPFRLVAIFRHPAGVRRN